MQKTLSDGTQILAQEDVAIDGHGTVQVGVIAFSDNSGDGLWDPPGIYCLCARWL